MRIILFATLVFMPVTSYGVTFEHVNTISCQIENAGNLSAIFEFDSDADPGEWEKYKIASAEAKLRSGDRVSIHSQLANDGYVLAWIMVGDRISEVQMTGDNIESATFGEPPALGTCYFEEKNSYKVAEQVATKAAINAAKEKLGLECFDDTIRLASSSSGDVKTLQYRGSLHCLNLKVKMLYGVYIDIQGQNGFDVYKARSPVNLDLPNE